MSSFRKKYGPLELWQWAGLAAVTLLLLYYVYRKRSGSSSGSNTAGTDTTGATTTDPTGGGVSTPALPADTTTTGNGSLGQNPGIDLSSLLPFLQGSSSDPGFPGTDSAPVTDTGSNGSQSSSTSTGTGIKSKIPGITGAIKSQKTLANGAILVTLENGEQIEQAPGKTPYVVKKAGAPAGTKRSTKPAPSEPTKKNDSKISVHSPVKTIRSGNGTTPAKSGVNKKSLPRPVKGGHI